MPQPKHAMEIFQLLDKSNCRECGEKTCLAFAGSVYTGRRSLAECPKLTRKILQKFSGDPAKDRTPEENRYEYLETLKKEIVNIIYQSAIHFFKCIITFDGRIKFFM